jgi:hypothetical protein
LKTKALQTTRKLPKSKHTNKMLDMRWCISVVFVDVCIGVQAGGTVRDA